MQRDNFMITYNYHNYLKCLQILHLDSNSQRYALKKIVNGSGKDKLDKIHLVATAYSTYF